MTELPGSRPLSLAGLNPDSLTCEIERGPEEPDGEGEGDDIGSPAGGE